MREVFDRPADPDYSAEYRYEGTTGACTLARLWVDRPGCVWLESVDGQRVAIPGEIRNLIAKRLKEATFRGS